jgi:hypothetical protein
MHTVLLGMHHRYSCSRWGRNASVLPALGSAEDRVGATWLFVIMRKEATAMDAVAERPRHPVAQFFPRGWRGLPIGAYLSLEAMIAKTSTVFL